MIRLAHATDIHWMVTPRAGHLAGKRLLGSANLYLRGRRHEFSREVQAALVARMVAEAPDAVAITGDLTAQALPAEFEAARSALSPVLDTIPTLVVPGNHDVYTARAHSTRRIRAWFQPWMGLADGSPLARRDVGPLTLLGLDPNRPTGLMAAGEVPGDQLDALAAALDDPALADRIVVLCLHYPILGPDGLLYDNRSHGLLNAAALVELLAEARVQPALVLHGHKHHGYGVDLPTDRGPIPIRNPGAGGMTLSRSRGHAGAFNVYELDASGLVSTTSFTWDGTAFTSDG